MSKTEELLAVLDLPEEEQWKWLNDYLEMKQFGNHRGRTTIFDVGELAGLAFRLRDEVKKLDDDALAAGFVQVYGKCSDKVTDATDCFMWFVFNAKPIHWIIAALIAKEQEAAK